MAMDPRKRQKKLEKQKARKKAEKRDNARQASLGFASKFQAAANFPILHCCMFKGLWEKGIGQVVVSRSLPNGTVAFAVFLVDVFCLGVKNAFANIRSRLDYDEKHFDDLRSRFEIVHVKPEYVRKMIEGAVQYADSLGLPPHPDYRTAKLIFGDISAESCTEQFSYGNDGKPLYVAGPNDDAFRCNYIMKMMNTHCGPGNFHYILPVDETSPLLIGDEIGELDDGVLHIGKEGISFAD
jgi:hypothetical protein